jgi:hypothetical protein
VTSEDFFVYPSDRDAELTLRCPLPGCSWELKREMTRLWFLLRESRQHIIEDHDS